MIITLIMEAVSISETPVTFYKTAWHSIQKDNNYVLVVVICIENKAQLLFSRVECFECLQFCGLDAFDPRTRSSKHSNGTSSFVKGWKFLGQLIHYQFLKNDSA
jgi:hypothetical protein